MRWQCGAEQPAPCALQGVCRCKGMSAVVDVRVHVGISPLCSLCSFFQQRGPVPPGVPLTPRSPAPCAFPRAAVAFQPIAPHFRTKTFCKSPTRCERCLQSVAAPAPLYSPSVLQTARGAGTLGRPAPFPCHEPGARSPLPRSFLGALRSVCHPRPFPSQPWAACPFYPFQGRESLRSLSSIAAFEGIYKLRSSPLRLL